MLKIEEEILVNVPFVLMILQLMRCRGWVSGAELTSAEDGADTMYGGADTQLLLRVVMPIVLHYLIKEMLLMRISSCGPPNLQFLKQYM